MCTTYSSQKCGNVTSQLFYFQDQKSAESDLSAIFNITSTSQDCANSALEFFCNATYRSCDDVTFAPSINKCEMLKNESCSNLWTQLQNVSVLTDCNMYRPPVSRTCPKQFRPSCDGTCVPLCTEFSQDSEGTIIASLVTAVISNFANLIGGIIVIVIAFFKRKIM